jgi:membrane-bound lytic murein transglycosylase
LKTMLFILMAGAIFSTQLWGALEVTPTTRVLQSVLFFDDLDLNLLDKAIERQLKAYERGVKLTGHIRFGTKSYPKSSLKDSLLLLRKLTNTYLSCTQTQKSEQCKLAFNLALNQQFAIYRPDTSAPTKYTSYYSPNFNGSRTRTSRFTRAIYKKPHNPSHREFSRVEIDYEGALEGKGYELFWVEESFFDLYLLHVQGGGSITLHNPDGTQELRYLSYDGSNGQRFKMIYHYLVEKGIFTPEEATVPNQRRFLLENPHLEKEIFSTTPSYIYFRESQEEPVGVDLIPLTPGRSLALDRKIYKTSGLITFVKTSKATGTSESGEILKAPFSRLFIAQDTGGAIKGPARCDLYFGYGPQAELVAYSMNDPGEQYFLIKKN